MTYCEFFGCAFIAFGPPVAMFIFTIARDPMKVIILMASAFFWLLALLFSSALWAAVYPLKETLAFGLAFAVIFQELFRFVIYIILRKAEEGLQKVAVGEDKISIATNKHVLGYVAGLGFGVASGAFSLVNVLADSLGPGTVGIKGDPADFFVTSALLTLAFVLLHVFWSVVFFHCCDRRGVLRRPWHLRRRRLPRPRLWTHIVESRKRTRLRCLYHFGLRHFGGVRRLVLYIGRW